MSFSLTSDVHSDYARKAFVIIRYSILSKKLATSWSIGRDLEYEDYKNKLFSKKRLDLHENIFFNLTIPSLRAAIERSEFPVDVIVATSSSMPKEYLKNLYNSSRDIEWLNIYEIREDDNFMHAMRLLIHNKLLHLNKKVVFSTIRLDDDDAISNDFFVNLSNYLREHLDGFVVSFASGYSGYVRNGKLVSVEEYYKPKLALGLAYIGLFDPGTSISDQKTIYDLGNHEKVDRIAPVILDSKYPSYIRSIHEESDMSQVKQNRLIGKNESEISENILENFTISEKIISS